MSFISAIFLDEVHLHVTASEPVEKELKYFFSLDPPQATSKKDNESEKRDRIYRLYNPDKNKRNLYFGLFPRLEKFAKENGHTIRKSYAAKVTKTKKPIKAYILGGTYEDEDFHGKDIRKDIITEEQFRKVIDGMEVSNGENSPLDDSLPFYSHTKAREYEITAMLNALNRKRAILLFRPEDNKHLVMCCLVRLCARSKRGKRCLFLAKNEMTVDGLYEGFCQSFPKEKEADEFCMHEHIQKLDANCPESVSKSILLANCKSVKNQPPEWFNQFDVVIVDEVDTFTRTSTPMMEKMTKVKYRIGIMSSTENLKVPRLVLEGLFGPIEEVWDKTTPKEYRSDLDATCIQLNYPDEVREARKNMEQDLDVVFLQGYDKRNRYIRNLACDLKGGTLITVMNTNHAEILGNMIREKIQKDGLKKEVLLIDKDNIANTMETDGWIVIAPYIRIEDGFPIHSLDNILLASPYKNEIRNLNAIGSGLKSRNDVCKIYDIADDLDTNDREKKLTKHAHKSMKVYEEERAWGLSLRKVEVNLK